MSVQKRNRFIDIHTHILPGMDDGAKDLADALELVRMAWKNGTGALVLTPHYRGRYRENGPEQLCAALEALGEQVRRQYPRMRLYLGNEAGWEFELADKLVQERVLTLNGTRYVLLEFQTGSFHSHVINGVLEVLNCGFIPIIAHAERYEVFRKNKSLANEVVELGALLQLNADSIMGKQGFGIKQYCHRLLKEQKVHFIASDAHDTLYRTPLLWECFDRVCRKYGEGYAAALFWKNAEAMLADETI